VTIRPSLPNANCKTFEAIDLNGSAEKNAKHSLRICTSRLCTHNIHSRDKIMREREREKERIVEKPFTYGKWDEE